MATELKVLKLALAARYRIDHEIGRGGMATVYRAHDLRHDRVVALKVLKPELADALGPERFLSEITLTARLDHPHILPLLDSGEAEGFLYYVMPFVEGESLGDRLRREKQLPLEDAVEIAREVADALSYAHGHGIVHRDVKPENILLSAGHARVSDFGIARAVEAAGGETVTRVTATGVAVGTPLYMSPEQAVGDHTLDTRSDIYSLACVVYEMLAGQPPFTGATAEAILARKSLEAAPSLCVVRETVPPAFDDAIAKALAKVPADRFTTASDFAEALTVALGAPNAPPPHAAVRARRRRLAPVGIAAATGLLAATLAWYLALRPADGPLASNEVPRLVVLPFENLGPQEDEYFADGITDEITARLAGLSGLAVIARQSAMQYKGTDKSPQQIGRELDAHYLLEATVSWQRASGGPSRVRIRPQLIRASDATHLWADVLDEELTDIFGVQTEIAVRVVEQLRVALRETDRRFLASVPTFDPEAHDYYLRGLNYSNLNKIFDDQDTRIAIGFYERAVELDPTFALAYAGLAYAHWQLYWFATDRTESRLAMQQRAAERAAALDPELVEGRLALAFYHYARFDYDAAVRELMMLRARHPHHAEVIALTGFVRRRQGQFDDAMASIEHATRLGPRSPQLWGNLGAIYTQVRNYAAAEMALQRALELSPNSPAPYWELMGTRVCAESGTDGARRALADAERFGLRAHPQIVREEVSLEVLDRRYADGLRRIHDTSWIEEFDWIFWFEPRSMWLANVFRLINEQDSARIYYEQALPILEAKVREYPDDPRYYSSLAIVYAGLGLRDEAVRTGLRGVEILPTSQDAIRGPYATESLARVYTMVGETEAALTELEGLLSIPGRLCAGVLRVDPWWDALREHRRFRQLVEAP